MRDTDKELGYGLTHKWYAQASYPDDLTSLKASCSSGPLPTLDYGVTLRLRCDRSGLN
ncbi:MAG: hypothetical protein IT182_01880 [Acidobacteria bacterium]|nr:hypothetical protein [Acidobacteriota bacterium]